MRRYSSLLGSLVRSLPSFERSAGAELRFTSPSSPLLTLLRQFSSDRISPPPSDIRNIAIIAHVDHGKTTLVDRLLTSSGASLSEDRAMDSNVFERERGITISAKYTSFDFEGTTFNIVDTPGHADFGAEVERAFSLVDGALLLVDASEGVMSQTKYVLGKALGKGLRPVVLLNKVDRPGATVDRCGESESAVFDTFAALDATEAQLDFPTLYSSAREGWASDYLPVGASAIEAAQSEGMVPLLRALREHVPPPTGDPEAPFSMLVVMTERDQFLGRIATGRVASGSVSIGDRVKVVSHADGGHQEGFKITKIFKRAAMASIEMQKASAGDVVSLAGASGAGVADTIASLAVTEGLPPGQVDPPTLSMIFSPNTSPVAGREGTALTGSRIGERLMIESETNVSLRVHSVEGGGGEAFEVQARGELQLGLLIENMRREGFELSISPPQVLVRKGDAGEKLEPLEELVCEVEEEHTGDVIEAVTLRKGELLEMGPAAAAEGRQRLVFEAPARGLIGFRSLFASLTRGSGILHRAFSQWGSYRGGLDRVRKGALIATASGKATLHALGALDARGELFVDPGTEVYTGMIVGQNSKDGDLNVNPVREKKLTNVRASGADDKVHLAPARIMSLEEAIGYVAADELIEVTPTSVRLRKRILDEGSRRAVKRKG